MRILILISLIAFSGGSLHSERPTPHLAKPATFKKLQDVLSRLDVAHYWLAGKHVDWLTGKPDGEPVGKFGHHTHCSAFVAAVCRNLGVTILEPPQHPQYLLADAQFDWLISAAGKAAGWKLIGNRNPQSTQTPEQQRQAVLSSEAEAVSANQLAIQGKLVVAVYHSPDETQPGHIAIVIPSPRSQSQLREDGPDVTQAGLNNYTRTALRVGFENHPFAWQTAREVRFFVFQP